MEGQRPVQRLYRNASSRSAKPVCEKDGSRRFARDAYRQEAQRGRSAAGGEQQRAALAKVLLCEPEILLLDEPTKGIDGFFKRELAGVLARLREQGKTIVMVSHDIEFCAHYATSVSMFFDGGIVTTNTPRRFFAQNSFYTTSANRMSRHMFQNAIIDEDVIALCKNA